MRLRLFPTEARSLQLLTTMTTLVRQALETSAELLSAPATARAALRERIHEATMELDDHTYALLTHLRTSFVNPVPREDLYRFSRHLREAISAINSANSMVPDAVPMRSDTLAELLETFIEQTNILRRALAHLGQLSHVEDDWLDLVRLSTRGRHALRTWKLEVAENTRVQSATHQLMLLEDFHEVHSALLHTTNHLGTVLVRES